MRYESSVLIKRPIDRVWAFLMDPFNLPRASGSWLGVRPTSPGPLRLGSTWDARMTILGFEMHITGTFVELDPPHYAAISVNGSGIGSGTLSVTLEQDAEGTTMTRTTDLHPKASPAGLVLRLAGATMRSRTHKADQKFKRLLEAEPG
jgi:carbon monoxide dehydrogenase subunit G